MKEHPILFSGPMVRAILDGKKSQTRIVIKTSCKKSTGFNIVSKIIDGIKWLWPIEYDEHERCFDNYMKCPYGQIGDRLWVRETFMPDAPCDGTWEDVEFYGCGMRPLSLIPNKYMNSKNCIYSATWEGTDLKGWKPSIHMPRWASRITLEITDIRVERLQDITEKDAMAEGVIGIPDCCGNNRAELRSWSKSFRVLWDSINEKRGYGWDTNPWVWVIGFKVV